MLTLANRAAYQTLLDAAVLSDREPDRDAIIYVATDEAPQHITRAAFLRAARRRAAALTQMGVGPHDLVIIAHTQSLESIFAFWGVLLTGAIPSMFPTLTEKLDPEIYMRSMSELVALSAVRLVLTTDELAPELDRRVGCPVYGASSFAAQVNKAAPSPAPRPSAPRPPLPAPRPSPPAPRPSPPAPHPRPPPRIAFLQHSSGTTGLQKGVALSHEAVLNQLAAYSDAITLSDEDVVASWLPLYHDMGLIAGFLLPLVQGIPLVLMSPFDWVRHPALLLRAIDQYAGTLCWLPNFAYNHMARRMRERDLEGLSLARMRLYINCSEPVRADSHELFLSRFQPQGVRREQLAVSYAMAENTFAVTQTPAGEAAAIDIVDRRLLEEARQAQPVPADHPHAVRKVSCGPAIEETAVRVLDDDGKLLSERQVGQLAVKSSCMLSEYYRRPDLAPFVDGWFLTGDMGYLSGGEVYIIGRSKDLIINAGKNVYPQDIEAIVNEVPGVHAGRAVAFGVYDEREGTELIAVVAEVQADDAQERKAIGRRIRQEVARQSMVTLSFVKLVGPKWLIKTSSGKIARAANRDKWRAARQTKNP